LKHAGELRFRHIFMLNAHDGPGHHTKNDKNLIFIPAKLDLSLDEADSLIIRVWFLYQITRTTGLCGKNDFHL